MLGLEICPTLFMLWILRRVRDYAGGTAIACVGLVCWTDCQVGVES